MLAYFGCHTSNVPTDAINGRLEALHRKALGFRNLTRQFNRLTVGSSLQDQPRESELSQVSHRIWFLVAEQLPVFFRTEKAHEGVVDSVLGSPRTHRCGYGICRRIGWCTTVQESMQERIGSCAHAPIKTAVSRMVRQRLQQRNASVHVYGGILEAAWSV